MKDLSLLTWKEIHRPPLLPGDQRLRGHLGESPGIVPFPSGSERGMEVLRSTRQMRLLVQRGRTPSRLGRLQRAVRFYGGRYKRDFSSG